MTGEKVAAAVAQAIAEFEPVSMIASPDSAEEAAQTCSDKVEVITLPIDDCWMRDTGPTFLVNEEGVVRGNLLGLQRLGREVPVQGGCAYWPDGFLES